MRRSRLYLGSQFIVAVGLVVFGGETVLTPSGAPPIAGVLILVGGAAMVASVAWQASGSGSTPSIDRRETYLAAGAAALVVVGLAVRMLSGAW